jgi:pimeloyl-ACP methyl ester carboxylesterase
MRMHLPLATELAERGHRVVTLDLLGHGLSDRPTDMACYSMPLFAGQAVALLDHLGVERAVVGGTSLGANVTLEVGAQAPGRVRGMLVEMPVLDHALPAGAAVFTPIMLALTLGRPAMSMVSQLTRMVPGALLPFWVDVALDMVRQDPGPSGAVIQGILFDRVAPPGWVRRTLEAPGAHHRPSPRPHPRLLRRRHARRRAPQCPPVGGEHPAGDAPRPGAAHRGDHRLPRRLRVVRGWGVRTMYPRKGTVS